MKKSDLAGRDERELFWYQRRSFLQAASAWISLGGFGATKDGSGYMETYPGQAHPASVPSR